MCKRDIIQKFILKPESSQEEFDCFVKAAQTHCVFKSCGDDKDRWLLVRYKRDEEGIRNYYSFVNYFTEELLHTIETVEVTG